MRKIIDSIVGYIDTTEDTGFGYDGLELTMRNLGRVARAMVKAPDYGGEDRRTFALRSERNRRGFGSKIGRCLGLGFVKKQ